MMTKKIIIFTCEDDGHQRSSLFEKKIVTPSVTAPDDTNLSDATDNNNN